MKNKAKTKEIFRTLEKNLPELKNGHGWKLLLSAGCIEKQAKILGQIIELLLIQQERIEDLEEKLEELRK